MGADQDCPDFESGKGNCDCGNRNAVRVLHLAIAKAILEEERRKTKVSIFHYVPHFTKLRSLLTLQVDHYE